MKTFILMTKLAPEVTSRMKDRASIGRAWLEQVKEKCPHVRFLTHYALLGKYDFMDIYEAPDEETAAKVSDTSAPARVTEGSENSRAGTTEAGKPRIAFHQKDFDFGKVEMGEKVEHIYRFRNSGTGTLVISKVGSS